MCLSQMQGHIRCIALRRVCARASNKHVFWQYFVYCYGEFDSTYCEFVVAEWLKRQAKKNQFGSAYEDSQIHIIITFNECILGL